MTRSGRKTKRRNAITIERPTGLTFIDLFKRRLSEPAVVMPWSDDDERRFQTQFNHPSPLSATLSQRTRGATQHAT